MSSLKNNKFLLIGADFISPYYFLQRDYNTNTNITENNENWYETENINVSDIINNNKLMVFYNGAFIPKNQVSIKSQSLSPDKVTTFKSLKLQTKFQAGNFYHNNQDFRPIYNNNNKKFNIAPLKPSKKLDLSVVPKQLVFNNSSVKQSTQSTSPQSPTIQTTPLQSPLIQPLIQTTSLQSPPTQTTSLQPTLIQPLEQTISPMIQLNSPDDTLNTNNMETETEIDQLENLLNI